jgi:hypothetical protein
MNNPIKLSFINIWLLLPYQKYDARGKWFLLYIRNAAVVTAL